MQPEKSAAFTSLDQLLVGSGLGYGFPVADSLCSSSLEFSGKSEGRSSANHKEAERKRRERINGHLDSLRALLLCNSKTDKASLLAQVVQRVKELKQQASEITQSDPSFPSDSDEITVLQSTDSVAGKPIVQASLCCEDRADLLPDLIAILRPLPLSPLRAEMATLGGRIRNVVVLAGDEDQIDESALLLRDALKSLLLRSSFAGGERSKRRRMFDRRIVG